MKALQVINTLLLLGIFIVLIAIKSKFDPVVLVEVENRPLQVEITR